MALFNFRKKKEQSCCCCGVGAETEIAPPTVEKGNGELKSMQSIRFVMQRSPASISMV